MSVWDFCGVKPQVTRLSHPAKRVLLVGNSLLFYNCGVNSMVGGFARAAGVRMSVAMAAIGGASLYWHDVKSYLRPDAIRSYAFSSDGKNTLTFLESEEGKVFDAVLLCDSSQGPVHPDLKGRFQKAAAKDCAIVREAGATPLLLVTWGYADRPGMTRELADSIVTTANENRCLAVPCGLAFEESRRLRPALRLIRSDNRHPTVAGTYLEAAVLAAVLSGVSPVGADFYGRFDDLVLSKEDGRFLQEVAWNTVTEFFGWVVSGETS